MLRSLAKFTLGVGGVVGATLTANYHLSYPAVDMREKRKVELGGQEPTPLTFPSDMETRWPVKFINSIGDTGYNLFGVKLFRLANKSNVQALEDLKGVISDNEHKELSEAFYALDEYMDISGGIPPTYTLLFGSFFGGLLKTRMNVEKEWEKMKGEIANEEMKPMIMITGLPRTGSTFLQNLLSQDPNCRFLSAWEQNVPLPFPTKETYETDKRIEQCRKAHQVSDFFVKNALKYTRMYHDHDGAGIEEEILVLLHTYLCPLFFPFSEKHLQWYLKTDKYEQYDYLKRFLRMNQHFNPPQSHFVLKSPLHGYHFGEYMSTFGEDKNLIVVTHRDPVSVAPSFSKLVMFTMVAGLRDVQNSSIMCKEMYGTNIIRMMKELTDGMADVRQQMREGGEEEREIEGRIVDVEYREIISNPMGVVEKLYEKAGIELTEEAKQAMNDYIQSNREERKKGGKGSAFCPYTLEEFGFEKEHLEAFFSRYRKERGY